MLDGEVLDVNPQERLATTFQARSDEKVSKDKASRLTWDLTPMGQSTKITLTHDRFGVENATYKQSASGWNAILSSLKTYVETGRSNSLRPAEERISLGSFGIDGQNILVIPQTLVEAR